MKTVINNLKILFLCLLSLTLFFLLGAGIYFLFFAGISNQWVWGSVVLFIFLLITWSAKWHVDWQHGGILLVVLTAFMGTTMDIQGNSIYNAPIQFFYRHLGTLDVSSTTTTINGTTGVNFYLKIINQSGHVVKELNMWGVSLFRFFEYLVIYSVLLSIFVPFFRLIRKTLKN